MKMMNEGIMEDGVDEDDEWAIFVTSNIKCGEKWHKLVLGLVVKAFLLCLSTWVQVSPSMQVGFGYFFSSNWMGNILNIKLTE